MTICKNCGEGIKWFKDPVNDKWIPLEADCNLEYENAEDVDMDEVLQWKHMHSYSNMQRLWHTDLL